jgi:tetratricopeptide (TPR) repeat protein
MQSRVIIGMTLLFGIVAAASSPSLQADAQRHVRAKQFVEARELYRTLAAQHPQDPDNTVWVGRLSGWLHDYETAEAAFDEVLAQDPTNVDALVGKAYVLAWQQRSDEAAALLARANELAPERVDVQLARVRQAVMTGDLRAADRHLDRVLELDPTNLEALELRTTVEERRAREGFFARLKRLFSSHS